MTAKLETLEVCFWSGGSRVAGVLSRPAGPGRYPTVIWSHGYGAYTGAIGAAVVADHFSAAGYALLRLDHRGCGRSAPSAAGPCVQGYESVQDLLSAVSYLSQRPDVDAQRVVLMGESHGGAAALAAGAIDRRVRGVLACDAFSNGESWLADLWSRSPRAEKYPVLVQRAHRAEEALARGEAPEVVPLEDVIPYAPEDLVLFHALCQQHPLWSRQVSLATLAALAQLRPACLGQHLRERPVRLLHGEEDATVPVRNLHVLRAAVGSADYHLIPSVGHGVTSACPEVVVPLMLEWLEKVLTTKGE